MLAYARALGVTYYAQNNASIIRQPLVCGGGGGGGGFWGHLQEFCGKTDQSSSPVQLSSPDC